MNVKYNPKEVKLGIKIESKEHPSFNKRKIRQIVIDHLAKNKQYYKHHSRCK